MRKQYLIQMATNGVLFLGLMTASSQVFAQDSIQLKQQVQVLQNRVNQLELQLGNKEQRASLTSMPVYDQWKDPFAQMILMRQQMENSMRQVFADTGVFSPKMDMKQEGGQYIITMNIPGMNKKNINVQIKDGTLIISGERQSKTEENKNNQYYRKESSFGSFIQAIPLPEDAKTDQIEARYKRGVLTVTVARLKKDERKLEAQKIMVN